MSNVPVVRLGELLSEPVRNGYSPICGDAPTGVWVLGLGALGANGVDGRRVKPAPDNRAVRATVLRPGDFLVSRSNTRDKVGRAAMWRGEVADCSYPDLMMRFRVDETRVHPEYLDAFLRSAPAQRHFQAAAAGTSGSMVKINKRAVETLGIPLPSLPEQKRIAGILATWDSAIEKNERLRRSKEIQYRAMVDRVASDVTTGSVRVASVATERSVRNRGDENGPVMSVTNRSGFEAPGERFSKRIASEDVSNYKVVRCGDYAYNPSRLNVGSIGRLDGLDSAILSPMYVVFSLDAGSIDSDYFLHWLRSSWARGHIRRSTQGSVRDSVGFSDFGAIRIALPSGPDQERMSAALNTARAEIALLDDLSFAYRRQKTAVALKLMPSGGQ